MYTLNQKSQAVLDVLTRNLEVGDHRKVDCGGPGIMAVNIDRLGETTWAVAHNYVQNGDLMCDPDVVFYRTEKGTWMPLSFEQSGMIYQVCVELGEEGKPARVKLIALSNLVDFCNTWMLNIQSQQGGMEKLHQVCNSRPPQR